MAERTLEDRYRLLAAAFRGDEASAPLRQRLGPGFSPALDLVVDALWRDVAAPARELDRERISSLLGSVLPGRLDGREPWAADLPDVVDRFLAFVAHDEALSTGWEWTSAVDEGRPAFEAALANPDRGRMAPVAFKPDRRPAAKIGRNEPCFCGSGKKYKHCCLKLES